MQVERKLAPNPGLMTGAGTNTYLVTHGGQVAVVDPGPDDPAHLGAVLETATALGEIVAILVTHSHVDHLPGAFPLARQTGAPILGHHLLPGVERPLRDGETLRLGDQWLVALETPGHTDDSLCFWEPETRALFTGDLVAGAGTVIVDDAPGGLARYMASLERLRSLGDCDLRPGHGPAIPDGAAKVREYIAHRQQRETQVIASLRQGIVTVDALVRHIYPDVAPGLVGMAARNVRAHLDKLRSERRAEAEGGRWHVT